MTKFIATILKVLNIIIVAAYLSACLIPVLPAGRFWMVAMLGLIFPILVTVVLAFLVIWLLARSRWALLSLVALLLSWQQLSIIAGINSNKKFNPQKSVETLRILSWNLSSWGETSKSFDGRLSPLPAMMEVIKEQQADVLCFQEFIDRRTPDAVSAIETFKALGFKYSYFVRSVMLNVQYNIGVVILSKYPITNTATFFYGAADAAEHLIYADIQFDHQKVRVFTTHLQSVRFDNNEYVTLRKIKRSDEPGLQGSKNIVKKLKLAYQYRGTQADLVKQKIKESPYPVIICGDFNDVPNSYTYFTIKGNLQDAFLRKGTGLGRTFQYLSPTLRIDYILADKKFEITQFNRIKVHFSDHYPVVSDLSFKDANNFTAVKR